MMINSNTFLSNFIDNSLEKLFLFLFFCQQPRPPVCSVNSEIHVLDRKPDVLLIKGSFRFRIMFSFFGLFCHAMIDVTSIQVVSDFQLISLTTQGCRNWNLKENAYQILITYILVQTWSGDSFGKCMKEFNDHGVRGVKSNLKLGGHDPKFLLSFISINLTFICLRGLKSLIIRFGPQ